MKNTNANRWFTCLAAMALGLVVGVPLVHGQTYTVDTVLANMSESSNKMKTMTAMMERTNTNSLFPNDPQKETGQVWIVRQGKDTRARVDNTTSKEIWLIDKGLITIFNLQSNRSTVYAPGKMQQGSMGAALANFVMLGFGQSGADIKKDYIPTVIGTEILDPKDGKKSIVLELKPKSPDVLKLYSWIRLWLDEKTWSPVQTRIKEVGPDFQTIRFTSIKRNEPVASSVFNVKLPKDTKK